MRLLGRLFVIAFALLLAITSSAIFLFFAALADPVMAEFVAATLWTGLWAMIDAVFASEDPDLIVDGTMAGLGRLTGAILIAPPVFVALMAEVIGWRRLLWHAGLTGAVTAAVPWLIRTSPQPPTTEEIHITAVLLLTGAVAGLVYWLVAGRNAGLVPSGDSTVPTPSRS